MTEPIQGPQSQPQVTSTPQVQQNAAPQGEATAATKVNSMADLQEKAPEVYKAMIKGIAQSIINRMKDAQERLKKIMRESQRG